MIRKDREEVILKATTVFWKDGKGWKKFVFSLKGLKGPGVHSLAERRTLKKNG